MTEKIKIGLTVEARRRALRTGHEAGTGGASVGRRTESSSNISNRCIAFSVWKHLPSHVEVDELAANGVLGLVDAVAKYDPAKRVKLQTYARCRIHGAILDGLRAADPLSRDLRRKSKKVRNVYRQLEAQSGRPVRDEEMAAASEMNLTQWHRTLAQIHHAGLDCASRVLTASPTTKVQATDPEILVDGGDDPFNLCYRREQREMLNQAISCDLNHRLAAHC